MNDADPTPLISPAAWRYARERARIEGRPVAEIIARMLKLGVEADIRHSLRVAPRLAADKARRKAA